MTIEQIVDSHLCAGCGACSFIESSQLVMIDSERHARRPQAVVSDRPQAPTVSAEAVCPGRQVSRPKTDAASKTITSLQDQWGPVLEVWEGYATDPEIRYRGSSGGAVTALALYCLEEQGMAGVLHVKARPEAPLLNHTVLSEDRASLLQGSGSRYAPASPCEELGQIENAEGPCVFIGKPCDVAATVEAARVRPKLAQNLGLTMGIFCAGTPSLAGTRALAQSLGVEDPTQVEEIRYRGRGWPGDMVVRYRDPVSGVAKENSVSYADGWGNILQRYRQWRCHMCADHTGEAADLSIGDPWYRPIEPGDPGRSLILVRTEKGRDMLARAVNAGFLVVTGCSAEVVDQSQLHLVRAQSSVWGRSLACRLLGLSTPQFPGKPLFRLWLKHLSLKEKIQSIFGTIRRVRQKRLDQSEDSRSVDPTQWLGPSKEHLPVQVVEAVHS